MILITNVRKAITHLNPQEIRDLAEAPATLALVAGSEDSFRRLEEFFLAPGFSPARRMEAGTRVRRAQPSEAFAAHEIAVYATNLAVPAGGFAFHPGDPERTVNEIIHRNPDLSLSLARHIEPFRQPVIEGIIKRVSKENALVSLATALPDIVPLFSLPWAVGEFATDTAVLTANQFRMAFLIAAACDRAVGYREQKSEIASMLLGAFGWRALARELVGKIPFGGGLVPKAAVAYAGTRVAGMSLERFYRIGYGLTRDERRKAYLDSFERGKTIAGTILNGIKRRRLVP